MEDVLEQVQTSKLSKIITDPNYPGIEFDENGEPIGACTIVELMDDLDRQCIELYGEEGRRMVNEDREEWNRNGTWYFPLF